ncbi:hypothetical protein OG455_13235 [Kitasatospora sp. NBC_01287]|uniref:hypothetical protein n=1 Tax=Kitasatospora sp. NBC_01287 TaxID=2903573 RepID=UPI0022559ED9|nr:hypothetical protein [Kitasatospora sp. NBC_01287]MCX4746476.1 hypothetical protein [Kitasatospora sp. NBC_01287]
MRVLAYEGRRLLGLRSSWLILAATLLAGAVLAAVLARRDAPGPLTTEATAQLVTAGLPVLAIPLAAVAAGLLGALAAAHEVRCPGLPASQIRYAARLRLLLAKLGVIGAVSALLALATLLLDSLAIRLALPNAGPGSSVQVLTPELLRNDHRMLLLLLTFGALVVGAGWSGVLAAALTRSAVAGILLLCALPTLVEQLALPAALELLHHEGVSWAPTHLARMLAVVLLPVAVLLAGCLLAQTRRRAL